MDTQKNIRGLNREGCKSIRRKLVRAITPLINNKSLGGYSVTDELNEAIDIMMQVNLSKDKFSGVEEFSKHQNMFEPVNNVAVQLAKKLEMKEKDFADFMQTMNASLEPSANGQADIFLGGVETKDDVLKRLLDLKKSLTNAGYTETEIEFIMKSIDDKNDYCPDKRFATEILKVFTSDRDGKINFHEKRYEIQKLEGFPSGLDLENCEVLRIDKDTVTIQVGGDWQQRVNITLGIKDGKLKIVSLYENDTSMESKEIANRIDKISTISKSLTFSGYKLQGRDKVAGMDISIENKAGSTRSGVDGDGHEWHTAMKYDYGYIRGTVGKDKDHLDAYLNQERDESYGEDEDACKVYVVHQNNPVTNKYDEDKVMLGWNNPEDAKKAYLDQYDRLGFFGDMEEMSIAEFKEKAFDKGNKGKMITVGSF